MNVSPQNVLEILDAASSLRIVDMKNYALDLIVQNYHQVSTSKFLKFLLHISLVVI